jgi:hypothetical protein
LYGFPAYPVTIRTRFLTEIAIGARQFLGYCSWYLVCLANIGREDPPTSVLMMLWSIGSK